jgi:hypothetical protein
MSPSFCWNLLLILGVSFMIKRSACLVCQVEKFELLMNTNEHSNFYTCNPVTFRDDDTTYDVPEAHYTLELPKPLQQEYGERIARKEDTYLSVPDGGLVNATIYVPNPNAVSFISLPGKNSRSRKLEGAFWNNGARLKLLPIRILTSDAMTPSFKVDDMYKYLFADANSLKWQFHRCSTGQLTVEPTDIGVLNVHVDSPSSSDRSVLVNEATTAAIRKIGVRQGTTLSSLLDYADLIMFITPPMGDDWVAFGSVGGRTSVYNDKWGAYLAVQMHEMG